MTQSIETASSSKTPRIAVILPCYNEAVTIQQVVRDFRSVLPEAEIHVFDNRSTDGSGNLAREAGAKVHYVGLQGKGNVVRRMFADIDADVYLMADADCTYDFTRAREMIEPVLKGEVDTVIATRACEEGALPSGHRFGNNLFNFIVSRLFGQGLKDIFSGYRAFSRRFAKSFPAHSKGFEIETEMSIYILEQRVPFREISANYGKRPEGSFSKLSTYRDGLRILFVILRLFKESSPLAFFTLLALFFMLLSMLAGIPVILEFMETGLVERLPTAILAGCFGIVSVLLFICGLVLDSVARAYREIRHLHYLKNERKERF